MSSPSGDVSLLDVLHHVPQLVHALDSRSRQSLLSCGRPLRLLVHGETATVRVMLDTSEARQALALHTVTLLSRGGWRSLQHLELVSKAGLRTSVSSSDCQEQLDDSAVAVLIEAAWPRLTYLALRRGVLCHSALHCLVTAKWQNLSTLHLSDTVLEEEAMQTLCKATWPLESLIFRNNFLTSAALVALHKSSWPLLCSLTLDINPFVCSSQNTFADLFRANVTHLTSLSLFGVHISAEAMSQLAASQSSSLQTLNLKCATLSSGSVHALAHGDFTQLRTLKLPHGFQAGIEALCDANWPEMENIHFSGCELQCLDIPTMTTLVTSWTKLLKIALNDCYGDADDACTLLTQGSWQFLHKLSLAGNELQTEHIAALATVSLPALQKLNLSKNDFSDETAPLLFTENWPQLQHLLVQGNSSEFSRSYLQCMSGVQSRMLSLRITVSSIKDITSASTNTPKLALAAFEQALLVACSSLVLRADCKDLSLHLASCLQSVCQDIFFETPDAWSIDRLCDDTRLLGANVFEFRLDKLFYYWQCMKNLTFDFSMLGKRFAVAIVSESSQSAQRITVACYPREMTFLERLKEWSLFDL